MASIISAGTTSATALNMSADTTGILQLASNNGTVGLTMDTLQNVGIGTASSIDGGKVSIAGAAQPAVAVSGSSFTGYSLKATGTGGRQYLISTTDNGNGLGGGLLVFYDQTANALRACITSAGNVGVNTVSPTQKLSVSNGSLNVTGGQLIAGATSVYSDGSIGTPSFQFNAVTGAAAGALCIADGTGNLGAIFFRNPNGFVGNISTSGSNTTYTTTSDYRLKENIMPMADALSVVSQLKPVTYTWKVDGSNGQGFIAHELQAVVPDCVSGDKDELDADGNPKHQSIDTSFLVATLTAAIQELNAKVTALENK